MARLRVIDKSKVFLVLASIGLLTLLSVACSDSINTSTTSSGENGKDNFRILISDDTNAIDKFDSVNISISKIGIHRNDSTGNWTEFVPDITEIDLKPLTGENALEIWSGNVTAGEYNKVFIYVDNVTGTLIQDYGGGQPEIKLPSNKLQISKPFTISENDTTSFVFDVTVVEAGKSGNYILQPQIAESGAEKEYKEMNKVKKNTGVKMEDKTWKLESFGPSDNLTLPLEHTEVTIRFVSSGNEFNGSAGCNSYFGQYQILDGTLSIIPPIGQTEIACPEPILSQEVAYLSTLLVAESYQVSGNRLQIICGDQILNFIKD